MGVFRDTVADLLRDSLDDVAPADLPAAVNDLFLALVDAVGEDAFATALPVGTAVLTIENGVVDALHVPAGVAVRVVDIDTDTDVADETVHDTTHTGPIGSPWAALAEVDERIARLAGSNTEG